MSREWFEPLPILPFTIHGRHQAGAAQRLRQDRHRRIRARARRASASRCSPPAAPPQLLRDAGLAVTEVADHTGFPEMLDGRVKTLHPEGARRHPRPARCPGARGSAGRRRGIPPIDLVVVNLYPFSETVARPDCTLDEAIENIDIGGPAMVRSAAKNYEHVAVVTDPGRLRAAAAGDGGRRRRARRRDALPARAEGVFPHRRLRRRDQQLPDGARRRRRARAAFRGASTCSSSARRRCATARIRTRRRRSTATSQPAPGSLGALPPAAGQGAFLQQHRRRRCGVGVREELRPAGVRHRQARQSLRRGGRGRRSPRPTARRLPPIRPRPSAASSPSTASSTRPRPQAVAQQFVEVVIAPGDRRRRRRGLLAGKANVRVLEVPLRRRAAPTACDFKRVGGGLLVQTPDTADRRGGRAQGRHPDAAERGPDRRSRVRLARREVRQVERDRVLRRRADARRRRGADEPRRLGAHRRDQGRERGARRSRARWSPRTRSSRFATASTCVAAAGATAIIQPGGSVRDDEVIAAADEHGIAMVFTGSAFPPLARRLNACGSVRCRP